MENFENLLKSSLAEIEKVLTTKTVVGERRAMEKKAETKSAA